MRYNLAKGKLNYGANKKLPKNVYDSFLGVCIIKTGQRVIS